MRINRFTRLPWLVGIVLMVGTMIAGAELMQYSKPVAGQEPSAQTAANNRQGQGVVCFGQVDLESGMIPLAPLQAGSVTDVLVYEGQKVKAGTELIKVQDDHFIGVVATAKAAVKIAEGELAEAKQGMDAFRAIVRGQEVAIEGAKIELAGAELKLKEMERLRRQVHNGAPTDAELDGARKVVEGRKSAVLGAETKLAAIQANSPQPKIDQATANLERRQGELSQATAALKRCTLRAPQDGTVLQVLSTKGTQFGPQSHQPALYFAPSTKQIVRAEVAQEFAGRVGLGAIATIHDEANAGLQWHGTVLRIGDAFLPPRQNLKPDFLSQGSNNLVLEVIISLDPADPMPRLGQRMRVDIAGR